MHHLPPHVKIKPFHVNPIDPVYPFQMVCSDYFTNYGKDYVVLVDRYSGWPLVFTAKGGAESLIKNLKTAFSTFGIPEEVTTDGGPTYTAHITQEFFKSWGLCF